ASARRLLRLSGLDCQLRYARSVADETAARAVPLPGLPDVVSQLAVPLVVCTDLVGVLAVESARPLHFGAEEETFLSVLAAHVAYALRHMLERWGSEEDGDAPRRRPEPPVRAARVRRQFLFYPSDDCVFVDGQYLIRNLPGRILWKLLQSRQREGRQE